MRSEMVTLEGGRRVGVHVLVDGVTDRTVVLCHPESDAGTADPGPETTWRRGITLLGVDRAGHGASEPMPPGQWAGVERTADDLAEVVDQRGAGPVGVAGWSAGGVIALALAARRPDLVARVAVVATPAPDSPQTPAPESPQDGSWGFEPHQVAAKTLLIYGAKDRAAGPRHGKWWQQHLPDARYEQVPGDGHLLITSVWPRVLSHLAPGAKRPGDA